MANITRIGKLYKPSFLEKDHPGRNMEERSKPIGLNGKEENSSSCVCLGFANGLSQALQYTPRCFGWERSSYGNYTSRGSTSHGS